ncbi:MAG: phosphoribosylformylglycinamidine synthase subunit PurQ [Acidimicrobiales bacterium]
MSARVAVVVFPGTNCEHDTCRSVELLGGLPELVWHDRSDLSGFDAAILPGGFAHGDYLRPGALARFSPVMGAVGELARLGAPVLGICNGFQVLTEAGLLPGALVRNRGSRFLCRRTPVRVETAASVITAGLEAGQELSLPVNHFSGSYVCSAEILAKLREEARVVLRYVDNPNGSVDDIAGVAGPGGNVVGIMPHPERACDPLLGPQDGAPLLDSLLAACAGAGATRATSG